MEKCRFSAVIVAAGNSTRYGGAKSKVFLPLGEAVVLEKSIMAFEKNDMVGEIIISARPSDFDEINRMVSVCGFKKVKCLVPGGETRQDSVFSAVKNVSEEYDYVVIHDGARPLVGDEVINGVLHGAINCGAAACGVPVKDTVKIVDEGGFVESTPQRDTLRAVQTPQAFSLSLYQKAASMAEEAGKSYTDDCQLMEAMGIKVLITEGDYGNIKITTPEDLPLAENLLGRR